MTELAIIVPCRLESTRFPRKLLHPIRGKPLVRWVAERIAEQMPELPLFFAVDDPLLAAALEPHGFRTIATSVKHQSGTDRLAEANRTVGARRVINVQADEPLVSRSQLQALADLIRGEAPLATLATRFRRPEDFANPNQVKVVVSAQGRALYFSRSPIPYARDRSGSVDEGWLAANGAYKHLGLYAYHAEFLERFTKLTPGRLEQLEKLEQLRALENGAAIAVGFTEDPSVGVDTPEDAVRFDCLLGGVQGDRIRIPGE
jgi:3-deoxy-manno-octulosonate cytidylyltransferase (CMP-KDO synthetase)